MELAEQGTRRRRDTRQQRGWYWYDWANSSFPTTVGTVFFGPYLIEVAKADAGPDGTVELFGLALQRRSSCSSRAPALSAHPDRHVLPIVGAFATAPSTSVAWLAGTAYTGAALTMAMFFIVPGPGSSASHSSCSPTSRSARRSSSTTPSCQRSPTPTTVTASPRAAGRSATSVAGCCSRSTSSSTSSSRVASRCARGPHQPRLGRGVVGDLHDHPAARARGRAGAAQRSTTGEPRRRRVPRARPHDAELRSYPETLKYLVAFLLFNGGVGTVIYAAGSYATEELDVELAMLTAAILMVQFVAFFGALILGASPSAPVLDRRALEPRTVERRRHLRALRPGRQRRRVLRARRVIGFVLGGTQALSRSLFSHLVPKRREAEFFGFYQISDRGTSVVGQLGFVAAYGAFGSYRQAILVLIVFFISGGFMLALTDFRKGIDAVGNEQPKVL
jgi:MFS transporter, UMF1 family